MGMLPGEGRGSMGVSRHPGLQTSSLGTSLKVLGDRFGQPSGTPAPWGRWGEMRSCRVPPTPPLTLAWAV